MSEHIQLEVARLVKDFDTSIGIRRLRMRALNDVSFSLESGKALAVVGESGSGKSTIARIIARMYGPTSGDIRINGEVVSGKMSRQQLLAFRRQVQMVFQDPFGSLNPTHTIYHHIARPFIVHKRLRGQALKQAVIEQLEQVGLTPAADVAQRYPHQLSGGQRQRVNIARAMAAGARIILADEPTSMLDVSIRIGVLNLMEEMRDRLNIGFMFITHDIATARYFAERIAVMYVGHMVEWGSNEQITQSPKHPYTQLLISAVPNPGQRIDAPLQGGKRGDIPLWTPEKVGCPFVGRCLQARDECQSVMPEVTEVDEGHFVRCHLYG